VRKGLLRDGKLIMDLKTIINQAIFGFEIRGNSSLRLLLHLLFFMDVILLHLLFFIDVILLHLLFFIDVKSWVVVSLVNPGENTKEFYNL
jgi:hypothetical protein